MKMIKEVQVRHPQQLSGLQLQKLSGSFRWALSAQQVGWLGQLSLAGSRRKLVSAFVASFLGHQFRYLWPSSAHLLDLPKLMTVCFFFFPHTSDSLVTG